MTKVKQATLVKEENQKEKEVHHLREVRLFKKKKMDCLSVLRKCLECLYKEGS